MSETQFKFEYVLIGWGIRELRLSEARANGLESRRLHSQTHGEKHTSAGDLCPKLGFGEPLSQHRFSAGAPQPEERVGGGFSLFCIRASQLRNAGGNAFGRWGSGFHAERVQCTADVCQEAARLNEKV